MVKDVARDPAAPSPRPRSVVARADRRHRVAFSAFVGSVILVAVGPVAWSVGAVVVGLVTVWDLVAWAWVASASRRVARGASPSRTGVDYGFGDDCWTRHLPAAAPYRARERVEVLARGSPAAAARAIRANLFTRLVFMTLSTSLGAMMVFSLWCFGSSSCRSCCRVPGLRNADAAPNRTALNTIRSAAMLWKNDHPGDACPTPDQLKSDKLLTRDFSTTDSWGSPFVLTCGPDEITGSSAGADLLHGTADDIVVPVPDPPAQ